MGNLNFEKSGYVINEDGSITRNQQNNNNIECDFVPVSTIKISRNIYLLFIYIPVVAFAIYFGTGTILFGFGLPKVIEVFMGLVVYGIVFLFGKYVCYNSLFPNKKKIFADIEYIQSNLNANNGYPLVMANNHLGVYDRKKKKVIVRPEYDSIKWIISATVISADLNGKNVFFDKHGDKLNNVPTSYMEPENISCWSTKKIDFILNKNIKVLITQIELRREYLKASLICSEYDNENSTRFGSETAEQTETVSGYSTIQKDNIAIPQTLRGAGPFGNEYIISDEELQAKRKALKERMLKEGKIQLKKNDATSDEGEIGPIRIPHGGLALKELTVPIYGIRRHRILRDGDGIITLVAFSGCPLNCKYCINPESNSVSSAKQHLTAKELYEKVKVDNLYFLASNGGITFGGGEPLLYADYIAKFALLSNERWNLNIETSLNVPLSNVKKVLPYINQWIVDIKDIDSTIYQKYTNHTNDMVVENLKFLASNRAQKKVLIRTPQIPNYNTDDDVKNTQFFLNSLGFEQFEELSYTSDVEKERRIEEDGEIGKVICEVLKKIRLLIAQDMGINFTPNMCTNKTCEIGTCPACEQELIDIQRRILEKYS